MNTGLDASREDNYLMKKKDMAEASILLVDDEEIIRNSLAKELSEEHFAVTTVSSGREAISALHDAQYDLVITDLMMPGMDGAELVSALRRSDPRLPILGMTGLTDPAAFEGTDNPPLSALLTKPFTREKLLTALGEVLVQPQKDGAASA